MRESEGVNEEKIPTGLQNAIIRGRFSNKSLFLFTPHTCLFPPLPSLFAPLLFFFLPPSSREEDTRRRLSHAHSPPTHSRPWARPSPGIMRCVRGKSGAISFSSLPSLCYSSLPQFLCCLSFPCLPIFSSILSLSWLHSAMYLIFFPSPPCAHSVGAPFTSLIPYTFFSGPLLSIAFSVLLVVHFSSLPCSSFPFSFPLLLCLIILSSPCRPCSYLYRRCGCWGEAGLGRCCWCGGRARGSILP